MAWYQCLRTGKITDKNVKSASSLRLSLFEGSYEPAQSCKKWKPEEDEKLKDPMINIDQFSDESGRSVHAIISRMKVLKII